MKRKLPEYFVVYWDFNSDSFSPYNVMPYFDNEWKEMKKLWRRKSRKPDSSVWYSHQPESFDEVKEWMRKESAYHFWSRTEYEVLLSGWPQQKNSYKLDIHEQIVMNLDTVAKLFYDYIYPPKKK